MSYQLVYTDVFNDCLKGYSTDQRAKADLVDTLTWLATNPFGEARLHTHEAKRARKNTFISDVGGRRGRRLIWRLVDRAVVLLLFGEHDPVERRAERLRLETNLDTGAVEVFDDDPRTSLSSPYRELRTRVGTLFMAWNDDALGTFGLEPQEIEILRSLDSEEELLVLEGRMRPVGFEVAFNLRAYGHPSGEVVFDQPEVPIVLPPAADEEDRALAKDMASPASRTEFVPVALNELLAILAKPIEDWMIFLHPDQAKLAARAYSGPARVRGPAGTGKTVVGLHRAMHLLRSYPAGRMLVTSYVRTLPPILANLYKRLDPEGASRIDFVGLHRWAGTYLRRAGVKLDLDEHKIDAAFNSAWTVVAADGSALQASGLPRRYFREEIDWVVKGRDLKTVSAYLRLSRNGRGTPLGAVLRNEVWALREEYESNLRRRKIGDWNDLISRALYEVRERGLAEPYLSVIVDESQDFTETAVRLVFQLAGRDRADGLVLLGDGQQSVYPGGYSLGALGIKVTGRSTLLKVNYRNTREVLAFAQRVLANKSFDDGGDALQPAERDVVTLRDGVPPAVCGFSSAEEHDSALGSAIRSAVAHPGVTPGDTAVLVASNSLVEHYSSRVVELGFPSQKLHTYDGTRNNNVKVGTYQRAKGLEFKHVFLPRLDPETLREKREPTEDQESYDERLDLIRRQVFVGMTRARDELWIGWVGTPSVLLPVLADD